jgi:hypothetical protein
MEFLNNPFWFIALPVSLIFLIQSILTFTGMDSHGDMGDVELSHDHPFQLFSMRNLIHFLLGFSWTGITCQPYVQNQWMLMLLSFLVGSMFVYLFFILMRSMNRLAEDNSFKISSTISQVADVYLKIPGNRSGVGKVLVSVGGSVHELDAMTENIEIAVNQRVKVIAVIENKILLVEKI